MFLVWIQYYKYGRQLEMQLNLKEKTQVLQQDMDFRYHCVTQTLDNSLSQQKSVLRAQILCLQQQIKQSRQRQRKLRKTNEQLTSMILSSSRTQLKKTTDFISKLQATVLTQLTPNQSKRLPSPKLFSASNQSPLTKRRSSRSISKTVSPFMQTSRVDQNYSSAINLPNKSEIRSRAQTIKRVEKHLYPRMSK